MPSIETEETENRSRDRTRMVGAGGGGWGVSVSENENVLDVEGADGLHNRAQALNARTEHLKMIKMVTFILKHFYQNSRFTKVYLYGTNRREF